MLDSPLSPAILIYNAGAGLSRQRTAVSLSNLPFPSPLRGGGDWRDEARAFLQTELQASVPEYAVNNFDEAREAARQAAQIGIPLVLAAGGDGTLRAVADGIAGTNATLGIVPRGTVNVLAREMGIPLSDVSEALRVVLYGETRTLDLGKIGERHFLLMCSMGFDAQAVADVNPQLKGVVGSPAYVLSALGAFANYNPPRFYIQADTAPERTVEAFMLVAANAASYGGDIRIAPDVSYSDNLLDVFVFEAPPGLPPMRRAVFLRQLSALALGRHRQDPDVSYLRARRLRVWSEPYTAVQIDGDPTSEVATQDSPLVIEAAPQVLRVRAPRSLV